MNQDFAAADFSAAIAEAWDFAAQVHHGQTVPGSDLPYLKHLGSVAMGILSAHAILPVPEVELAVVCAILHDSIEDQSVEPRTLVAKFGQPVAEGVLALSKDPALPKADAMLDSLERIKLQPKAIWCVRLSDRITNLRGAPAHWSKSRVERYKVEGQRIHEQLGSAHAVLAAQLASAIERYPH
jgi:(p)ppGpp synthase/HD superfamily hydrolase